MFILLCFLISLLPVSLFLNSFIYFVNPEGRFNEIFSYKTKKSIKSYKARVYGNKIANKLCLVLSPLVLLFSLYLMGRYREYSSILSLYIIVLEIGMIWLLVIPVDLGIYFRFNK